MASAFSEGFRMGSDIYDSSERMKLMKEQQDWARADAEEKAAERGRQNEIRTAGKETFGMAGKPVEYQGGTMGPQPEDMQTALRPDIATAPAKMYTEDQAQQDYLRRLKGIDIGKAQEYEKGALELGGARRKERYDANVEAALTFNKHVIKDASTGMSAEDLIKKHIMPVYNDGKLPGTNDGQTMSIVPSALDGGKPSVVLTDSKGNQKVLGEANMNMVQTLSKKGMDLMLASASPEEYHKHKSELIAERNAASQETSAGASALSAATNAKHLDAQIRADLFGAQAAQARGSANQANAHAAVFKNMVDLAKTNKEAGEAVKESLAKYEALTDEEKAGPKGQQILTEGALAAAKKSGDITGIMNALKKPDRTTVSAEYEKNAYAALNKALESQDQKQVEAAKAAYPKVFGEDPLVTAFKNAQNKNNPSSPTSPVAASTAIPTGSREELKTQADQIDGQIAALRSGTSLKSSPADRAAASTKIADLQKQRNTILNVWAKTPSALPVNTMPMAQP